ncbi:DnaJ domain-containing protein [Rhodanobacter sp. MP1X3]|uniref:J domain-containing protein n=1 Tax=unclassified Rhodanobacter TaxID=2621553 RepID=UPI001618BE6D|nr:DnaJ like chaperone protein [Rhodanobacter sp. MP1X3]MBB6245024.1 DnaJ like chaperone protein [Rhodanobacter sp. A1T4]
MTITQIVIIVAGLVAGYKLMSLMLSPGNGDKNKQSPRSSNDDPGTNDQRDRSYDSAWSSAPSSSSAPAWYQTLGVAESASLEEIDHAYRVQISQYHPDKVAKLGDDIRQLAEARSKEINSAYDIAVRLRR